MTLGENPVFVSLSCSSESPRTLLCRNASLCAHPTVPNCLQAQLAKASTFMCRTFSIHIKVSLSLVPSFVHLPVSLPHPFTRPCRFHSSHICPLGSLAFDQVLLLPRSLPAVRLAERTVQRPGSRPPSPPGRKNKQESTCS